MFVATRSVQEYNRKGQKTTKIVIQKSVRNVMRNANETGRALEQKMKLDDNLIYPFTKNKIR